MTSSSYVAMASESRLAVIPPAVSEMYQRNPLGSTDRGSLPGFLPMELEGAGFSNLRNPSSISQPSAGDQTPAPISKPPPEDCIPARCPRRQYFYEPLEDPKANIRVLELLPGMLSDGFRIRILEASIDSDVPYEALSHT